MPRIASFGEGPIASFVTDIKQRFANRPADDNRKDRSNRKGVPNPVTAEMLSEEDLEQRLKNATPRTAPDSDPDSDDCLPEAEKQKKVRQSF